MFTRMTARRTRSSCAPSRRSRASSTRPCSTTTRSRAWWCTASPRASHMPTCRRPHPPGLLTDLVADDPAFAEAFRADLLAVFDRDPACTRLVQPILYFKGFHAIQAHRLAHALVEGRPPRFRALPAEPLVGRLPDRHQSRGAGSARASSSITPPASSSARRPSSRTTSRCCRT